MRINVIHHINEGQNPMITSIDKEKAFYKIQHIFIIKKKINKLGMEGNFFNLIKDTYEKPTANIIVRTEGFLPKNQNKTRMCPYCYFYFIFNWMFYPG